MMPRSFLIKKGRFSPYEVEQVKPVKKEESSQQISIASDQLINFNYPLELLSFMSSYHGMFYRNTTHHSLQKGQNPDNNKDGTTGECQTEPIDLSLKRSESNASPGGSAESESCTESTSDLSLSERPIIKQSQRPSKSLQATDGRTKRKKTPSPTSSADQQMRFTCTDCGKHYATSSNLSRHKQTHRSIESNQAKQCPHCNKIYVSMPALSMHVLTHKLKHACKVCDKAFSRPWLLQGHMRSHTGERPFGCAHCDKKFADRSNLRAHMQTHNEAKEHRCNKCNKTFALKSYLSKHLESACLPELEN